MNTPFVFTKMHGLGNDFVVIDAVNQTIELSAEDCRAIADRRFGIGCDQILVVEPPPSDELDFTYRIFNADGGEVEQCGNGARCFAVFVRDQGLTTKNKIRVATAGGIISPEVLDNGQVRVDMGAPNFSPASLPLKAEKQLAEYHIDLNGESCCFGAVSMGNPHAVIAVDSLRDARVEEIGPMLQKHPLFPKSVNVGFIEYRGRDQIGLRVYERGVGETLACGTGACAAVAVGRKIDKLDECVVVELFGGELTIEWSGDDADHMFMTGPASTVFTGEWSAHN